MVRNEEMMEMEHETEVTNETENKKTKTADESMYEDYMSNLGTLSKGAIVTGKITNINGNEIYIDIGYKSEGIITADDFAAEPETLKIGNEVSVQIVSLDGYSGYPILSKSKADQQRVWNDVYNSFENGLEISGKIGAKIKGGYEVYFGGGIKAFLPLSQVTNDVRTGASIGVKVIEANRKRNNVVVSRKVLLEEEKKKKFDHIFTSCKEGDVVKVRVARLKDYGAFVDYDGIEGLLHITDVCWGRVEKIEDVLAIDQQIEVKIIKIDQETRKISFGMKQLKPEPWSYAASKYPAGTTVNGKVTKLMDFGIFVQLEEGLEGLVHISDISWTQRVEHPKDVVTAGENISVKILNVDQESRRISLGIKQLSEDPWSKISGLFTVNSVVTGTVVELLRNGFTVELSKGIVGFVNAKDISWTRKVVNPAEVVKPGDNVEVRIMELDAEKRRLSLGLKQVALNPWTVARDTYPVGSVVEGKVTNITRFGAFVELSDGIEGLVHVSDLSWTKKVNHPSEVLSKGAALKVRVLEVNSEEQRISLGYRQVMPDPWTDIEDRFPVGTMVEGRVVSLTSFGAFVELEEGIEGLVHISDMSWNRKVQHPNEVVTEGDLVRVKVTEIDAANRKIKLGLKQVTDDPMNKYKKGAIFEGEVTKVTEFGLFVKLEDGIEGLVHKSHLIDDSAENLESAYPPGTKMAVSVIECNREKRQLRLSAKEAVNVQKIEEYRKNLDVNISGGVSLAEKFREALAKNNQEG